MINKLYLLLTVILVVACNDPATNDSVNVTEAPEMEPVTEVAPLTNGGGSEGKAEQPGPDDLVDESREPREHQGQRSGAALHAFPFGGCGVYSGELAGS